MNISKIIKIIIKWYQIFAINILNITVWINNKNIKFLTMSKEKAIYNWIKKIKKIIIIKLLICISLILKL